MTLNFFNVSFKYRLTKLFINLKIAQGEQKDFSWNLSSNAILLFLDPLPFYHPPVILPRAMSRILLTVLFAHLCMVMIKILIFTFVTQMQFDTRSPNYFPLAVHQQSQAQRASLTSKWSSLINIWHWKQCFNCPVLFKMKAWSSSRF